MGGSGTATSVGSSGSSTATGPGGAGGSGAGGSGAGGSGGSGGSGGEGQGGASQGGGGLGGEGGGPPDLLALGDACDLDAECQSDACVEGVCCTTACDAGCESCLAALSGGTDGTCAPIAAEVVCRAPAGSCDQEETCDGLSPDCPADAVAPGGAVCRAPSGACDLEETCDGLSSQCPADQLDAVSVCRSAASPCDAAETCSGSDADCPPDEPIVCNVDGQLCIEGACANARRAFVTSTTTNGDLGGVSGADATCQARAIAGGLTGTFKAWVSTSTSSPAGTFVPSAVPYVRVDGTKIADDWADLIDGSLDAPLLVTELGLPLEPGGFGSDFTWTGTGNNGAAASPHCADWTSASSASNGVVGNAREASSFSLWLNRPCDSQFHLYCFEQ